MNLGELKRLVNSIDNKYNHLNLHDGNPALGAPIADLKIEIVEDDLNRITYLNLTAGIVKGSGKHTGKFTDIQAIANEILANRKIGAIKEIRNQLTDDIGRPLSLIDSKAYIERYMPMGYQDDPDFDCQKVAAKFIADHSIEFLHQSDFLV